MTDQQQEEALQELRHMLGKMEAALGLIDEAIVWIDESGRIDWCNGVFDRMTGQPHITLIGKSFYKILPISEYGTPIPEAAHPAQQVFTQNSEQRGNYQISPHMLPVHLIAVPLTLPNQPAAAIITIKDISEKQELEQVRRQSLALQAAGEAIVITDAQGTIEWINHAFTTLTGYTPQSVYGKKIGLLNSGKTPSSTYRNMWATITQGKSWKGQLINKRADESLYYEEQSITPVLNKEGAITHYIAIKRDITQRITAEQALAASRRKEIDIASRIQKTLLLGRNHERIEGIQYHALSIPSQEVDGDFFDCFIHSETCMDVVIGDVMGKGVPAALLGGAVKSAILRTISSIISSSSDHHLPHPHEIVSSLHAGIARELIELESFITLFYARIDTAKGTMRYIDCGHTRAIHCSENGESCDLLSGHNPPIGFLARETYHREIEVNLRPGGILVLYSDGITEAVDANEVMFGEERLVEIVHQYSNLSPGELLEQIHQEICTYTQNEEFADDLTCIVIKMDPVTNPQALATQTIEYAVNLDSLAPLGKDLEFFINEHYAIQENYHLGQYCDFCCELLTGLNEAAMNVIQHAFPHPDETNCLKMTLSALPHQIQIELCHNGIAFTGVASIIETPTGQTETGYGLYIMEQCFDGIHYTRAANGWNRIVMMKDAPSKEPETAEA